MNKDLSDTDPAVFNAVNDERVRQESTVSLIASENHVSEAVLRAQGSVLTNKYAEGYPGQRYYAGCEHVDEVERLAIKRAKRLWGADHVNVQPHSGTQANQAVYNTVLEPGDKILSLDLNHGGHLSHGAAANFTGQLYKVEHYYLQEETQRLDYDGLAEKAKEFEPDIIVSGFSAYPRKVNWERIQEAADDVGAYHLTDIAHITGLIAAGVHPSPVGVADFITGSTHKTIRAGRGGIIMCGDEHADAIDKSVFPGSQGGPLMHNIAGKAVGFKEALKPEFEDYAKQVVEHCQLFAEELKGYGYDLVTDGTDNHLLLVDLRDSHPNISGSDVENALAETGIILNGNTVPNETRSPFNPSGVRIGTPSITTRGFSDDDVRTLAQLIDERINNIHDDEVKERISNRVESLCDANPIYEQ